MRAIGVIAIAAWLAASATAHAGADETIGKFTVPPPVSPQRSPEGAPVRPIKFAKIAIHLKDGEPWAEVRSGLFSSLQDPLVWDGGRAELKIDAFERIFAEELKSAGFKVDGDPNALFEDETSGDLRAGVLISEMHGRFCYTCTIKPAPDNWVKGAVLMKAEWQIYSTLERGVVASIPTTGGFETQEGKPDNELRIIYGAFRENVRALLADPKFRALITSSPTSLATAPPAAQSAIAFRPAPASAKGAIAQAANAVVAVFASDGMGSGFLISSDGYVITNQHVVGGSKYVKIRWSDGVETVGEVVRSHKARDVAVIKTDPHGRQPLMLRRGGIPAGETVFAVGTPLEEKFQGTLTKGIVSANRVLDGFSFIQSDVAVDHGNSGGPLLDEKGAVVGLTQWGYQPDGVSHDLNFFIPIGDALDFLALTPAS